METRMLGLAFGVAAVLLSNRGATAQKFDVQQPVQLTDLPLQQMNAMISPAGDQIAFWGREGTQTNNVWLINSDGKTPPTNLTSNGNSGSPAFSRDGQRILYSSTTGGNNWNLWSMRPDGTEKGQLTSGSPHEASVNELPNGRLLFQEWGPMVVATRASDGSDRHLLPTHADVQQPRIDPSGRYITYHTQASSGTPYDIFVYDILLGTERQLTSDACEQGYPSFSPDGKWIVYQSKEDGGADFDIWITDAASGTIRQHITTGTANDMYPHFFPDGYRVLFSSGADGGGYDDLWVVEIPEPCTLVFFCVGFVAIARRQRMRRAI